MAAVQEGILDVMEVSTSWSQSLKCTVLKQLPKGTGHHLPSKSNPNREQRKKSFRSLSRHRFPLWLSSVSNTGKRENPPTAGSTERPPTLRSISLLSGVLEGRRNNAP